jgi:hypothetical protein
MTRVAAGQLAATRAHAGIPNLAAPFADGPEGSAFHFGRFKGSVVILSGVAGPIFSVLAERAGTSGQEMKACLPQGQESFFGADYLRIPRKLLVS